MEAEIKAQTARIDVLQRVIWRVIWPLIILLAAPIFGCSTSGHWLGRVRPPFPLALDDF